MQGTKEILASANQGYLQLVTLFLPAVPNDAPAGILVNNVSSHALLIEWSPPSVPNGIITAYTMYINYNNGTSKAERATGGSAASYLLEGLSPFQLVGVQMTASTSVGEGPRSNTTDGRTNSAGTVRTLDDLQKLLGQNDHVCMVTAVSEFQLPTC